MSSIPVSSDEKPSSVTQSTFYNRIDHHKQRLETLEKSGILQTAGILTGAVTDGDVSHAPTGEAVYNFVTPTAWTPFTFAGAWVNYGGGYQAAAYRLNIDVVELKGAIKSGAGLVTTLPVGFRAAASQAFLCSSNTGHDIAYVDVDAAGGVTVFDYAAGGNNSFVDLSQVRFSITS